MPDFAFRIRLAGLMLLAATFACQAIGGAAPRPQPLTPRLPSSVFITGVRAEAGATTANILWTTLAPATGVVEFGPDLSYGAWTASNSLMLLSHVATLTGLAPNTPYYFQIHCSDGTNEYATQDEFSTTILITNWANTLLFGLTNTWKYTTSNLDGVNWPAPGFSDTSWGSGAGLLWVDDRASGPNPGVQPKGFELPTNGVTGQPFITYYFRTQFTGPDRLAGGLLTFSNYIDDGAVFYVNGAEVFRNNLPGAPTTISNDTFATTFNCSGDATCPVVFSLSGNLLTNLVSGDNALAVEVHNSKGSPDVTFGASLTFRRDYLSMPDVGSLRSAAVVVIYWNGEGLTLQEASQLNASPSSWTDVPGPVTSSPYLITNAPSEPSRFYRVRGQ